MKKLFIILISGTVLVVAVAGASAWLSWQPQSWYEPPDFSKPAVNELVKEVQNRLDEEFHNAKRDPPDVEWHLRIPDRALNALLPKRLGGWLTHSQHGGWLTHSQHVEMPEYIQGLQVRTTLGSIWLAAMIEIDNSRPRPIAVQLNLWIENGKAFIEPMALRFGKIPIPISFLKELVDGVETSKQSFEPIIQLTDVREVEIKAINFEDGAIVLTCQTHLPQ